MYFRSKCNEGKFAPVFKIFFLPNAMVHYDLPFLGMHGIHICYPSTANVSNIGYAFASMHAYSIYVHKHTAMYMPHSHLDICIHIYKIYTFTLL